MARKSPSVDVLLVEDVLLALSMGQQVFLESVDDEGHSAAESFAAFCASPSRHVLFLLLPFLLDEAVDPDSAYEVEPIRALASSLLELDDLVLLEFGSAASNEHSVLAEELVEERQFLGLQRFHKLSDTLDTVQQLLNVGGVLWLGLSLLDSTSLHVLL